MTTQAAEWRAAMADAPTASVRAACDAWLAIHPDHARAYQRLLSIERELKDRRDEPVILSMRQDALARAALGRKSRRELRRRWTVGLAFAAGLALVIGPIGLLMTSERPFVGAPPPAQVYATAVGQRMNLTLQDGSQVTLNTASRLRVAYSGSQRRLHLDQGQAWFDVAKDATRPFSVVAGDRVVTAYGTQFDVRVDPNMVRVVLAEGRVSVAPSRPDASAAAAMLKPHDVLTADAAGVTVRRISDLSDVQSWRDGVVVFDDQPLSEVVNEINRYAARPVILQGKRVGELRISGVYRVGGEAAFVEALRRGFPVSVDDGQADRLVLSDRR